MAGLFIFYQYRQSLNNGGNSLGKDPFIGFEVPTSFGEDEKRVTLEKLEKVKKFYNENPNAWEAWIEIGNFRILLEDYEGAIEAFQNSLVLQSNNILGYRNIAEVYRSNLKDYTKAEEYYRLASEVNSVNADIYIVLSRMQYGLMDKVDEAEETIVKGINATDNNQDLLVHAIRFYEKFDMKDKAKLVAEELLDKYPDNSVYQQKWGHYKK